VRVQITHLKAPWPLGAVVGDVLELETVPAWAVGKCKPAPDGAELTNTTGNDSGESLPSADEDAAKAAESLAEAETQASQEKAAIEGKGKKHK